MASEWREVGEVCFEDETVITVSRNGTLTRIMIASEDWPEGEGPEAVLNDETLGMLRELLDRAAMPGQPGALDPATRPAADDEIVSPSCNYDVVEDTRGGYVDVGADLGEVEIAGRKLTLERARELLTGLQASIRHCEWWLAENGSPLTVAAVDPAAMEALGELADAAQEMRGGR